MRFRILGATEVYAADGRRLAVGGARLRALLVLLLLDADRVVGADRLIHGLYGDRPPGRAGNALQSQVSRLRQLLADGAGPSLEFHPAGYRLAVDPEEVDVHRFTRLVGAGQRALASGDPRSAAELLRAALELWRGEPLADVRDAPFAAAQVARLVELRLGAVEDRVEAELGLGASGSAIGELRDLVAAYPLRERLRGQLMRALHAAGRRAEALAVFAEGRRLLAEELGTDPSPELAALHLALLRDGPAPDAGPPVSAAHPPASAARPPTPGGRPSGTGLPAQLSSFVGREDELRRVGKLLDEARLVTLHGPGGVGKTRLAIEAAGQHAGEVRLVELAALTDGAEVAQAVLAALNLRDAGLRAPGGPPDVTDRLVAALADRRLLLVLDNCEHVVAEAARLVARLLGACPGVRILATSREPLGITGEAMCPVSGLRLPATDVTPARARDYAAVRLFVDRAADVVPGFDVDDDNVDAVLRICRTLDGLPLAIELAAARLRVLPVAEIAARLDDRFRLLSRGSRVAEPRHQTLRAVVRWSWDLLDDTERRLARRMTVFAGGGTLDAIERVCGLSDDADVLDVLTGLVDKSLVEAVGGRYRMLETIRAFCAERLVEAGEAEPLRRAHAAYFLDLARTADRGLRGADQLTWLRRLDAERDNLHVALRRALAGGDVETALRLVAALSFYWWLRGLRGEGAALAGQLVARLGSGPPPGLDEEYVLCVLQASLGGHGTATHDVAHVGGILWSLGHPPRHPFLLYLSGVATGPPVDLPVSLRDAPAQWVAIVGSEPWSLALGALGAGMMAMFAHRHDEAWNQFDQALGRFRALGERWGTVLTLTSMIELAYRRGDRDPAPLLAEALRLVDELDSTLDMAELLRTRADGRVSVGDPAGADADYRRVTDLAVRAGAPELRAAAYRGRAEIARIRGDRDLARRLAEQSLAECPTGWFGAEEVRLAALVTLGQLAEAAGDLREARARYRQVLVAPLGLWEEATLRTALEGWLGPVLRDGDPERAGLLLGAVTAVRGAAGSAAIVAGTPVAGAVRERLGDAAYERLFAQGAALSRTEAIALINRS
ncbi:BTAD domain-containing putative transcriptional regulator [Micromonospora sp. HM5-17]|uniref:ATP-binding protein n=1 Tax=Micromonospora sp. HM5-17 TaxID=2487710 RepID=UPI000F49301E|nr:BTAD domain-containing putative transcriptional regulator [Micromonospora sp. HM5-17]ROT27266.1 AfsR/SARP family transcriptional regulator [Micromonospora sp. HM5-17]